LLASGFNKQKEEVHGNEFDRNFQRFGGNKLLAGAVVVLERFFFAMIFCWPAPITLINKPSAMRLAGVPLASIAVPLSGVLAIAGGLSILLAIAQNLGMAHRAVPGSGHVDDAQVLDRNRSHDGADTNDSLHEKCLHARGALLISHFGAGPFSLDARRSR